MDIVKSTRHQKIIGNFRESFICNWLSRSGFEVALIDHTGLDIVAYNPSNKKRLGITVKSRTRFAGQESSSVNILSNRKNKNDRGKLLDACKSFACDPWIGIYVKASTFADLFLTSLKNYDAKYRRKKNLKIDAWKMTKYDLYRYDKDKNVMHIIINFSINNWKPIH
jgi:hypothetical protein